MKKAGNYEKRNWFLLLLIVLCLAAFFGYRKLDQLRTDTRAPRSI